MCGLWQTWLLPIANILTMSDIERKIRARLPIIRFMQVYMPLSVTHWLVRKGVERLQMPPDISRKPVNTGAVQGDWLEPDGAAADRVLLYLHGGGFVIPQTPNHLLMAAWLARETGMPAFLPDYRVAPKHPFPAALDDCIAAYHYLLAQGFNANKIVIAGDSAGGNLSLATLMKLRDQGDPLPAAAACLSPSGDLTEPGGDVDAQQDLLLPAKARRFYRRSYVADNNPENPYISPLHGDWHGFPPLLIHAAEDEILCQDARRIRDNAAAAGVDVQLEVYPGMWHVWQINLQLPQAIDSLRKIAAFLKTGIAAEQAAGRE